MRGVSRSLSSDRRHARTRGPRQRRGRGIALQIVCALVGFATLRTEAADLPPLFIQGRFDRNNWTVDPVNPPGLYQALSRDEIRFVIPPGPDHRPPANLQFQNVLLGDFDVSVDFRLDSFSTPVKGWSNLELSVAGRDGRATVIRTERNTTGPGFTLWYKRTGELARGRSWPHLASTDKLGTLRLRRMGGLLRFEAGNEPGALNVLGQIEFGERPIDDLRVRVVLPATHKTTDISLLAVRGWADPLVIAPPPAGSALGAHVWRGPVFVGVVASLWIVLRVAAKRLPALTLGA